jgi:hypothetical protein
MRESTISLIVAVLGLYVAVMGAAATFKEKRLPGLWKILLLGIGAIMLVGALFLLFQAKEARDTVQTELDIKTTIIDGTALELDWYKNPSRDLANEMNRYFLPGGDRIKRIAGTIESYRMQEKYYSDDSSRALFLNKISILSNGKTAFVETSEIWYQIIMQTVDGIPTEVLQTSEQRNAYTPVQFYILTNTDHGWRIMANPAPSSS